MNRLNFSQSFFLFVLKIYDLYTKLQLSFMNKVMILFELVMPHLNKLILKGYLHRNMIETRYDQFYFLLIVFI
jgi:hypothetical protein